VRFQVGDSVRGSLDLAEDGASVHSFFDVHRANDGSPDATGQGGVFASAELDHVQIDPVEDALDFVDRLPGEDADEQRLAGGPTLALERFRVRLQDLDAWAEFAADGSGDSEVDPPGGVGEDHADRVGASLAGPLGVFDGAD
jgi:hypothetical protein